MPIVVPAQVGDCAASKGTAQSFRLTNLARIFINLSWCDIRYYTSKFVIYKKVVTAPRTYIVTLIYFIILFEYILLYPFTTAQLLWYYTAGVPNLWPAGQMWPFSKKTMALFKSKGAKKKLTKKFGKIGKKVRVDGPRQKKVPNFPIFWPIYHKRLATPAIQYTLYTIQSDLFYPQTCCSCIILLLQHAMIYL